MELELSLSTIVRALLACWKIVALSSWLDFDCLSSLLAYKRRITGMERSRTHYANHIDLAKTFFDLPMLRMDES